MNATSAGSFEQRPGNRTVPAVLRMALWLVALVCFLGFCALVVGSVTAPSVPFLKLSLYDIDQVVHPGDGGALQPGDRIDWLNGKPYYGCMYLWRDTPIYDAPRDQPVKLAYSRMAGNEWVQGETSVIFRSPGSDELLVRGAVYIVGLSFLVVGGVIFIGSQGKPDRVWLGLTGMLASLVVVAGPDVSDFEAPFSAFYWIGLPVWTVVAIVAHARWPVNQLRQAGTRLLLGLAVVAGLALIITSVARIPAFDCSRPGALIMQIWAISGVVVLVLPLPSLSYLLGSAYRQSKSAFARSQIRSIFWAVSVGLGAPILLSILPIALGLRWVAPPELMLMVSVVIPVSYLFTAYGTSLLGIERFLSRWVFVVLLFLLWIVVMFTGVNGLYYWVADPHPLAVAFVAAAPVMALGTFLRKPFGWAVDLALYGMHYDYETVVAELTRQVSTIASVEVTGRELAEGLRQALSIRAAALWARRLEGAELTLVSQAGVEGGKDALPPELKSELCSQWCEERESVHVFNEVMQLEGCALEWYACVVLRSGAGVEGLLLLGPKQQGRLYSDKDARVLTTLASWVGNHLASWRLSELKARRDRELTMMLVDYEEMMRSELAEEVHDQGITALSLVRLMVERGQKAGVVMAALQKVIDDLRSLAGSHLLPLGLQHGLLDALEGLAAEYRGLGADIRLVTVGDGWDDYGEMISGVVGRELLYIVREAVSNAFKHGGGAPITIRVIGDGEELSVAVVDQGPGFDVGIASLPDRKHRGLSIMRARCARIGADLSLDSSPATGTTMRVVARRSGVVGNG